jgi:protein-tyrosine phosphatase
LVDERVVEHIVWKLPDKANADFLSKKLVSILESIDRVVVEAPGNNQACLVHCAQGISRSAGVCAAYYISRRKSSLQDALATIRLVRPQVQPNLGILASLRAIEQCGGNVEQAMKRMKKKESVK